jgi:hypothetical protein
VPRRGCTYSAWGFNPRNPPPPQIPLKGRKRTRRTPRYSFFKTQTMSVVDVRAETDARYITCLIPIDLAPLQGAVRFGPGSRG